MEENEKTFTQEEVNKMVGEARKSGRDSAKKEFEGWISPEDYNTKVADIQKQAEESVKALAEAQEKLTAIENEHNALALANLKTRIALANGLDFEMADYLKGETEEELGKSAEFLKSHSAVKKAPPAATEPSFVANTPEAITAAAYKQMAHSLNQIKE